MNTSGRTAYITFIAACYLVICSLTCIYYLSQAVTSHAATIPWSNQFLCLGAAISAGAYFFSPSLGHRGLIVVTLLALFGIGESDSGATRFHVVVLAILLLPMFLRRWNSPADRIAPKLLG